MKGLESKARRNLTYFKKYTSNHEAMHPSVNHGDLHTEHMLNSEGRKQRFAASSQFELNATLLLRKAQSCPRLDTQRLRYARHVS